MSLGILGWTTGGAGYYSTGPHVALFPSEAVEGCLCRVWIAARTKNGSASSPGIPYEHALNFPSDWTAQEFVETANAIGVDDHQAYLFWKILTAADIAAGGVTFTQSGDPATKAWIVTCEDVADAADPVPFSDTDFDTGNTDPHNVPGFTTTVDGALAWVFTTDLDKIDSPPGDLTELAHKKVGGSATTAFEARCTIFYRLVATAGAVGPWSIGLSSGDDYAAISSWTKPDAGSTPQELTGEDTLVVPIRFNPGKIDAPEDEPTTQRELRTRNTRAEIFPIVALSPERAGAGAETTYLAFRRWQPAKGDSITKSASARLRDGLEIRLSILRSSRVGGRGLPTAGSLAALNPDLVRATGKRALADWLDPSTYRWSGRDARLYLGGYDRHGARIPFEQWVEIWRGTTARTPSADLESLTVEFTDSAKRFDRLTQTVRFAGTGGLEGGSDWAGKAAPRGAGVVRNAPLAWVDVQNGIGVFHVDALGRACREVLAVKSRLNPLTAPPAEQAQYEVTLGAVNYIKLQTGVDREKLTIDFVGPLDAGDTLADISYDFLVGCDGVLTDAEWDLAAAECFRVECPGQAYYYLPPGSEERLGATADNLYSPFGWWTLDRGLFRGGLVPDPRREVADFTLRKSQVGSVTRHGFDPELWWLKLAYAKSWTTFDRGDVAEAAFGTEHGDFGLQEFRLISQGDESIRDAELLAAESVPWVIHLADEADAEAVWRRGWDQNKVPSELFEIEVADRSVMREARIGRTFTFTHDGFESSAAGINLLGVDVAYRDDGLVLFGWAPRQRRVLATQSGKKFKLQSGKLLEVG
jgi:hypothetical protein